MLRQFTQKEKKAIKEYYAHRKNRFLSKTKRQCLETIGQAVKDSRKLEFSLVTLAKLALEESK